MNSSFKLGLEKAILDYEIFRNPNITGVQRQRATEIDAAALAQPSRMFELGKKVGIGWFVYTDERYGQHRRDQYRAQTQ